MNEATILLLAAALLAFAVFSRRLETGLVTAPMAFTLFGFGLGDAGAGVLDLHFDHEIIDLFAEFTLILVLFTDASKVKLMSLQHDVALPARMLLIGMPLVIAAGIGTALLMPLGLGIWEAAVLAAILAPTDAALGQAVVTSERIPEDLRRSLTVESGLNDGLALPVVLFFACLASIGHDGAMDRNWLIFTGSQLLFGPLAGVAVGRAGASIFSYSHKRGWLSETAEGAGAIGLAIIAYRFADLIGGNGFIAAFVAGLVFGNRFKGKANFLTEFMEAEGQTLVLIVFAVFGASLLPEAIGQMGIACVIYALLSVTIIRTLPVFLSLTGCGKTAKEKLFLSWFGPRGLASILFAVLLFDGMNVAIEGTLLATIYLTVTFSIILHGITAAPSARLFSSERRAA